MDITRAMNDDLLAARIPVVVYVAPDGARAGSAGLFLTMASDVAAMAPQTNIGSASPVVIGPQGPAEMPRILYRKLLNDTAAYVRTLAEGHGRNANLAERMVRRATNVTASRARRERLVDVVAGNETELLKHLDGFRVKGGRPRCCIPPDSESCARTHRTRTRSPTHRETAVSSWGLACRGSSPSASSPP